MRNVPRGLPAAAIQESLKQHGSLAASEICRYTGLKYNTVSANVRRLIADGALHISGWTVPVQGCQASAIYTLGAGPSAPKAPAKKRIVVRVTKAEEAERWARTEGLQMVYPVKSVFAGGVNPWTGA